MSSGTLTRIGPRSIVQSATLDRTTLARGMVKLGVAFNREINDALLSTYHEVLADLEPAYVDAAVLDVLRTEERWFPPPAVIRRHAEQRRALRRAYMMLVSATAQPDSSDEYLDAVWSDERPTESPLSDEERTRIRRLAARREPC